MHCWHLHHTSTCQTCLEPRRATRWRRKELRGSPDCLTYALPTATCSRRIIELVERIPNLFGDYCPLSALAVFNRSPNKMRYPHVTRNPQPNCAKSVTFSITGLQSCQIAFHSSSSPHCRRPRRSSFILDGRWESDKPGAVLGAGKEPFSRGRRRCL